VPQLEDEMTAPADAVPPTDANPDPATVDPQEKALVTQWLEKIQAARKHWAPDFKRMREDMDYARQGADDAWMKANNYYVPIVPRMIAIAVASLYARDPKFVSEPTKRLSIPIPLDDPAAVQAAMATPDDPKSQQILQMLMMARQEKVALRRFAQTVEMLAAYFLRRSKPRFKRQMKALVRRTKTTGVGYLKLDFQRAYTPRPEITQQIADTTQTVERLVFLKQQLAEGEDSTDIDAKMKEAQIIQERLMADPGDLAEEGPVFDFLKSTQVIPDKQCTSLDGFVGADWVATELCWPNEKIESKFKVKLKTGDTTNKDTSKRTVAKGDSEGEESHVGHTRFYEVQDRVTRTIFYVAEGQETFLRKPQVPAVKLERFWTIFTLMFNETEHENKIFPFSDVTALKPTQTEYNSARQALSDHRIAAAPRYVAAKGMLNEEDKAALKRAMPFDVTEVTPPPNGKVSDVVEQLKLAPIDTSLYDTEHLFQDALRITGAQQANFGAVTGASATETSIAENTRSLDTSSQVDDLDDFLSDFGDALGEVMMLNLQEETVRKIVGPGAVWSEFTQAQLQDQLYLTTKAGSTGRPNRAAELANLEKAMLWMLQMPSVSEVPLIRKGADLLDIDYDELYLEAAPSLAARNQTNGQGVPGSPDDPNAQGDEGSNKTSRPSEEQKTHRTHPSPAPVGAG
jgi:hypothetical protein